MGQSWILQCRPGFELECAAESEGEVVGEGVVRTTHGMPLRERIFARQAFREVAVLDSLPAGDRINPILAALGEHAGPVNAVLLEHPDTNVGKELSGFFRKFTPALTSALAKRGLPVFRRAERRLHLLFTDSKHVRVGFSAGGEGSPQADGI